MVGIVYYRSRIGPVIPAYKRRYYRATGDGRANGGNILYILILWRATGKALAYFTRYINK